MYYTNFAVKMALLTYFHMWPETNRSDKSACWHKVNGRSLYTLKLTPQQKTIVASTPLKTRENLDLHKTNSAVPINMFCQNIAIFP